MAVDERDDLSVRLEQLIESSVPPVTFEEVRARAGAPRRRRRVPVRAGVAALLLAVAVSAGLLLSIGGDDFTVGTADQDALDGGSESDTSSTEVRPPDPVDLGGAELGWIPDGFELFDTSAVVDQLFPGQSDDLYRALAVTFVVDAPDGTPPEEVPDLSISISEDPWYPSAGTLPDEPTDNHLAETVTLSDGTQALVYYGADLRYGSVDWFPLDHVKVIITGGPMSRADLIRVADGLSLADYRPCVRPEAQWDLSRSECQRGRHR